jgi:PBSX family phage portal protein
MKTTKPNNQRSRKPAQQNDKANQKFEVFSFGDPVPMLDKQEVLNYTESRWNGLYYETPVNMFGLAKSQHANPYHASALAVKRNLLTSMFQPHPWFGRTEFMKWVQDFLVFGNAYLERHDNARGNPIRLQCRPAKYTRRGKDESDFVMLLNQEGFYRSTKGVTELETGRVFHLIQPDVNQEIYGVPEYLSVLQSAWLGESATLYRRKYYAKGHSGYILYMTDAAHEEGDVKRLREKLKSSTGLDAAIPAIHR